MLENAIVAKMPNPELTKIVGEANYANLNKVRKEVYQNLYAIDSPYGGGTNGHLGLGMPNEQYTQRTGHRFEIPDDPGVYDANIAHNAGTITQARREAEFNENKRAYQTAKAVEKIIKQQLKKALPVTLLNEIEDEIEGLENVTIIDIFDHCFDRKGRITDTMIDENNARIDEPYDPALGIAVYIKNMEECQQLATDAGDAFTDMQLVRKGQLAMAKTGLFDEYYKQWLRQQRNQRTWVNFKTFWTDAINEWDELNKLTAKGPTFGINAATQEDVQHNLEYAIDNLAMAAATDKSVIQKLTDTNNGLMTQLNTASETIKRLTEDNQKLLQMVEYMTKRQPMPKRQMKVKDDEWDPEGYCWSHGFKCRKGHNSMTCTAQKHGHKRDATRSNIMGGSMANKEWAPK